MPLQVWVPCEAVKFAHLCDVRGAGLQRCANESSNGITESCCHVCSGDEIDQEADQGADGPASASGAGKAPDLYAKMAHGVLRSRDRRGRLTQ